AVGQRAGQTRKKHEYFRGIAEPVVAQRQPTPDVVGDMVKKDPPERDASAGINAQIAAVAVQLRQRVCEWLRGGSSIKHLVPRPASEHVSRGTETDVKHQLRRTRPRITATVIEPPGAGGCRVTIIVQRHRA